jgi:hypothetical protein
MAVPIIKSPFVTPIGLSNKNAIFIRITDAREQLKLDVAAVALNSVGNCSITISCNCPKIEYTKSRA